jgi:hypothetical protein
MLLFAENSYQMSLSLRFVEVSSVFGPFTLMLAVKQVINNSLSGDCICSYVHFSEKTDNDRMVVFQLQFKF